MSRSLLVPAVAALVAALAACGGAAPEASSDLERDLVEVRASTVHLAPHGAERTMVVSAEEQTGAAPRVAAPTRSRSPRRLALPQPRAVRARSAPVVVATPAPRAEAEAVASAPGPEGPQAEEAPAVTGPLRRLPAPEATPEPPGGWRSTSDVIRNAPFPINP